MKKNIKKILIWILFLILAIIVGKHHEPWADEAQAWLIARDYSLKEIFLNISSYEGCFPLWHIIIKIFIFCGLEYKYYFIIPIIISSIALIFLLKNDDIPLYFKILLPFSYYFFYQYTIIARNYCLILLAFSLLTITYKNRFKKPVLYLLNLIFFSLISLHGMVISFTLMIMFSIKVIKEKEYKKLVYVISIIVVWIFEVIVLFPNADLYMNTNITDGFIPTLKSFFIKLIFFSSNKIHIIQNVITIIICFSVFGYTIIKQKNKDFIVTEIGLLFLFVVIRAEQHHYGLFFLLVIFGIMIDFDKIKNNKNNNMFIKLVLVLYCIFSVQAAYNDINYNYCGSKDMAEYIENNIDIDNSRIFTIDYYTTSLLPYFEKIIYKNREYSYYKWASSNTIYYYYCNYSKYEKKILSDISNKYDYVLIDNDLNTTKKKIIKYLVNSGLYELEYSTSGYSFYKNSYKYLNGFLLYKKIDN